jgi:hypothetical protein
MNREKYTPENKDVRTYRVKTGLQAGYWTCTGVTGPVNKKGVIQPAYASSCWK